MVDSGPGYTGHTGHTVHTVHAVHAIHAVACVRRKSAAHIVIATGRNLRSICARRAEEGCQRVIWPPLICTDKGPGPAV